MTVAEVRMWGTTIGAVAMAEGRSVASFQYAPGFIGSGIEVAPLQMPLGHGVYSFPHLAPASFHGLPGMLAESLPDRFGNALIDAWLARQGRTPSSFNPVERLCYTGTRGMGALEYVPSTGPSAVDEDLSVARLVALANRILSHRESLATSLEGDATEAIEDILRVGTSAGGARAKAVIAWNRNTGQVHSGQGTLMPGFEHWLLKFDGVADSNDTVLTTSQGFGAIEYAYSRMAQACGIEITECRLLEEGGRRHFMTRRFDRVNGDKLHMQSLGALGHFDYNLAGAHAYEQAFDTVRRIGLAVETTREIFRRMVFNIVARNQDDHVKNMAFLMDRRGRWFLAPAYDLTYACQPSGTWTASHQMTVNGKRDHFTKADIASCGQSARLKRGEADRILQQVTDTVRQWRDFADEAGVQAKQRDTIWKNLRLTL